MERKDVLYPSFSIVEHTMQLDELFCLQYHMSF